MSKESVAKTVKAGVVEKLTKKAVAETEGLIDEKLEKLDAIELLKGKIETIDTTVKKIAAKLEKQLALI